LDDGRGILFHTLTFGYRMLSAEELRLWRSSQYGRLTSFLREELTKKRFISSENKDDILLRTAISAFSRRSGRAPSVYVYLTTECNMRCPYCFQDGSDRHISLAPEDIGRITDSVKALQKRHGRIKPVFFGGEPLLAKNKEVFVGLIEALADAGCCPAEIVTNGTQLREFLPELVRLEHHIEGLRFTLYGPRGLNDRFRFEKNGSRENFGDTMRNIRDVIAATSKLKIYLNLLLDQRVIERVPEMIGELRKEGVLDEKRVVPSFGRIQFRCSRLQSSRYPHELNYEDYYPALLKLVASGVISRDLVAGSEVEMMWKIFRGWETGDCAVPNFKGCRAVYPGRYCFYPDGLIYPCTEIAGCKGGEIGEFRPGLRFFKSLDEWNRYPETFLGKCAACKYIGMCNGACPATNMEGAGRIDDLRCINYKDSLDKFLVALDRTGMLEHV